MKPIWRQPIGYRVESCGEPLSLPEDAALPDPAFLAEHRAKVFRAA